MRIENREYVLMTIMTLILNNYKNLFVKLIFFFKVEAKVYMYLKLNLYNLCNAERFYNKFV